MTDAGPAEPAGTVVFLFDTTHHCLWAEEVAHGAGMPAEVVPAPPDRGEARCDLALETFRAKAVDLGDVLSTEGVEFYWPADVSRPDERVTDGPAPDGAVTTSED